MKNLILLFIFLNASCHRRTDEDEIRHTIRELIISYKTGNFEKYREITSSTPAFHDLEGQKFEFEKVHNYINKYLGDNLDSLKYKIPEPLNEQNYTDILVPIYDKHGEMDSTSGLVKSTLEIGFGPKDFVPYSKPVLLFVHEEHNVEYRLHLIDIGKIH